MATEKQLLNRIGSLTNMAKITKSMKLVSAAKLKGDQKRLDGGKEFAQFVSSINEPDFFNEDGAFDVSNAAGKKTLIVPITSDRGLCGGVNNQIAKLVLQIHSDLAAQGDDADVFIIGEKGRPLLRRRLEDNIVATVSDNWKVPANFANASAIAQEINAVDFDNCYFVFNTFKSAVLYLNTVRPVKSLAGDANAVLPEYEVSPESRPEVMENLQQYAMASSLFTAMLESAASEQSSRMQAMENASKNAEEMVEKITMQYNRARQARITTELIEIISGASALEDAE
jgi:F-type H+-transporting ATPase subunit gamma